MQRGALLSALEPDPGTAGHVRLAPLLPAAASETAFMAITGRPPRPRKVTLRRSRELGELIAACRFGVHPWETLADSLASALDCSVSRALQVMRAALKAGLLAPALPVDDQDPRFLQACLDALPEDDGTQDGGRQDGGRQDGGLRPTLRDITELTGLLATDDAESRPGLMGRLRAAAERLPHPDTLPLRVYEDAVADLPATPRPTTVLRAAADLLPVLAAFDLKADLRLALQAALRVRGGRARLLEDAEGLADEAARLATSAAAGGGFRTRRSKPPWTSCGGSGTGSWRTWPRCWPRRPQPETARKPSSGRSPYGHGPRPSPRGCTRTAPPTR